MGSGKLRYVRIEFAGFENIQGAGLLLQDVTKETVLENIEVSYAHKTSAFEFSGGNCNAKNLVSYASNLHDFYIHNGYQGMLQNLLAWRHPFFPTQRLGPNLAGLFVEGTNTFPLISKGYTFYLSRHQFKPGGQHCDDRWCKIQDQEQCGLWLSQRRLFPG
jgi:hypothetical protein